ncbi:DUF7668 domain-containing protein [Hymenobacter edaphi]|uniref:DUF7668 domain-containing protein n=1 Tax=Hymenobacter edaphi TaxID=2211146 RepID=A0A328BSC8_9BACT|nr:hypothetical protein [Hymenobacter edaphi]RAK70190.1 hypothetical protein DLM85_04910 [Hymenobacter edaphi]
MKKNRIRATVSFIVEHLAAESYDALQELDYSQELPSGYIKHAVIEYGGRVTLAPTASAYKVDVIRHADITDKIFVDVRLWFDGQESDMWLQCAFHTDKTLNGLYRFSITDLDVL